MKNLKIMGLALVAMFAMSAVVASAASAAAYKSEVASPAKTFVTGTSEGAHVFQAGAKVECVGKETTPAATGEGSFVSGATTLTATNIVYTGCKVAGQAATVSMNGCSYEFGEPTGTASPFTVGTIKIVCPSEKKIVITATTAGCKIEVGGQTTTGGTTTATNNAGPPKTVTVAAGVKGIVYTGTGGICGSSGTAGTYSGKFLVKGFKNEKHTESTGIFVG